MHRVRYAMTPESGTGAKLSGVVECDETYIRGKPRRGTGLYNKPGRGNKKTPVLALVERKGDVRTHVITDVSGKMLKGAIRNHVHPSAAIITDEWPSYRGIGREFSGGHTVIRHLCGEYSINGINTNTAESFFSLLKRGVYGTFHHVSKTHLHRYCSEFEFRWNHRNSKDGERMEAASKKTAGKRLTYQQSQNEVGWVTRRIFSVS
jgi:hypothetical protein